MENQEPDKLPDIRINSFDPYSYSVVNVSESGMFKYPVRIEFPEVSIKIMSISGLGFLQSHGRFLSMDIKQDDPAGPQEVEVESIMKFMNASGDNFKRFYELYKSHMEKASPLLDRKE